jgi:pyruvate-formate lyase-activating enzyme
MSAPGRRADPSPLDAERLGIDASAGRRFDAGQQRRLEELAASLAREVRVTEARVTGSFAALRLGGGAVVVLEPAAEGVPGLFTEGGIAVRYNGAMGEELRRCLIIAHRHLKLLPGEARRLPPRRQTRPDPRPVIRRAEPDREDRPEGPEAGMRLPMPLMAVNGGLALRPHDAAVRRVAELLWKPCPTIRLGCACNLACAYCSVGSDGPPLIPEASLRRLLGALRGLGYRGIGYMGGEPTIHPDFPGLVRRAAGLGFRTQVLVTNGIRLADRAFAADLFAAGIDVVILSLDSFDPRVQERLFGGRAVHGQALAGLHNALAEPRAAVVLAAVVTAPSAPLLPRYMEEAARLQRRCGKPVPVLLHILQRPARNGPEQKRLELGLLEAALLVRRALARARALGVTALTFSLPPCMLPGHERSVVELYATEWVVDAATGEAQRSRRRGTATYWKSCAACPHVAYCPGVLDQYADAAAEAFVSSRRWPTP